MPTFLSGLKNFIASWDDPFVEESEAEIIRESPEGNINTDGTAACYNSPIFRRYHRKFKRSLEVGVRELTAVLILKFNCITYSSCQGHRATADAVMRQRYVGIIPRDKQEYDYFLQWLQYLASTTNSLVVGSCVRLWVDEDWVESEEGRMGCLHLFFVGVDGDEERYFEDVEVVYQQLLQVINGCL